MRPVIHRKIPPCTTSSVASRQTKPSAMRKYRLRYQTRSGIGGELVSRAPDGDQVLRLARVGLDLLAQPFHQRVDAALGDMRLCRPDALEQHLAGEHDARMRG